MRFNFHKKGAALITALFIMTLIASASVAMIHQVEISIKQAFLVNNYDKAYYSSEFVTTWARTNLIDDLNRKNKVIDPFPKIYQKTKIDGGSFTGQIFDAQAKFNINALSNPKLENRFIAFLKAVAPDVKDPQALVENIIEWISATPVLGTDRAYEKAGYQYKVAHAPLINITQLRQVMGITQPIYQELLPYVTALPTTKNAINPNTAPAPVLMMTADNISLSTANEIHSLGPFKTDSVFYNEAVVKNHNITGNITTKSDYFLSRALVKLGDQTLLLNSLLHRTSAQGKPAVLVLWQNQGIG